MTIGSGLLVIETLRHRDEVGLAIMGAGDDLLCKKYRTYLCTALQTQVGNANAVHNMWENKYKHNATRPPVKKYKEKETP